MPTGNRLAVLRHLVRANGVRWLMAFAVAEVFRRLTRRLDRWLEGMERSRRLPGFFGAETQRVVWDTYDWSQQGEEWTVSEPWKRSVIEAVLKPHADGARHVLEIGPGAGRWSVELQRLAQLLTLMDVSSACIQECRARFASSANVDFVVNDGRTIPFPDDHFDRIWSFDVFVHIGHDDIASYLSEIFRVLAPGGRAMIHHTADGGIRGHWRSHMTAEAFISLARRAGLAVVRQFDTWEYQGERFDVKGSGDTITELGKPL